MDEWERNYGWVRQAAYDADENRAAKELGTIVALGLCGIAALLIAAILLSVVL